METVEQNPAQEQLDVTPETEVQKKIAERVAQSFSSRLAEYLTGLKPEDPAMLERLAADQEYLRAKYNLPSWDMPASEFERALRHTAEKLGVKIIPKAECGNFFEENPYAGAIHFDDNRIGIDIDKSEYQQYVRGLSQLEHELIHSMQIHESPSMPPELKEYEAYTAGANLDYLKKHPEQINEIFFHFFVGGSVNMHYYLESERRGEEYAPNWDNPEYFLRRDGIDPDKVKDLLDAVKSKEHQTEETEGHIHQN
jgi:hypothetical protein